MARKNILTGLMDENKKFTAVNSDVAPSSDKPAVHKPTGALGAVTRSIDALAARADAAKAIEQKLAAGDVIIDLDPSLVDDSFVADRVQRADDEFESLVEAIRSRGQDSPVLLRPYPNKPGYYQIVFGHRRVRAARVLGRSVRAVVKDLDDRDHVIAQGQENAARADLSFIERTMFASRLEERGFDRETIMLSMNTDKTTLSKMLSVPRRIPNKILGLLEAADAIGRDRWHDLASKMEDPAFEMQAGDVSSSESFYTADANKRFEMLEAVGRATKRLENQPKAQVRTWRQKGGEVTAKIKDDGKQFTLALKARNASAFGTFIAENLEDLYESFEASKTKSDNGDN
jgi:ParB family transcriptional regulator, chromosome partitioning protein